MNHWPECVDIKHGTPLRSGDSNVFKWNTFGHKWPHP